MVLSHQITAIFCSLGDVIVIIDWKFILIFTYFAIQK